MKTPILSVTPYLDDNVLQQRIPFNGVVDLRLVLVGQVDRLGVAPPLEVEDPVVIPACRCHKKQQQQKNPDQNKSNTTTVVQ